MQNEKKDKEHKLNSFGRHLLGHSEKRVEIRGAIERTHSAVTALGIDSNIVNNVLVTTHAILSSLVCFELFRQKTSVFYKLSVRIS